MYLTLWTLRVSPLYVYRHFSLCLSPALDSVYYTVHVLDSMFIVTLCLEYLLSSMYLGFRVEGLGYSMYLTLWTLLVSPVYVYRHFTLCLSPALDSVYYTLHVPDSVFVVTLCLYHLLSSMYFSRWLRTDVRGH